MKDREDFGMTYGYTETPPNHNKFGGVSVKRVIGFKL